ncbi:MAG: REP-associated tyrosine transposase, partial [Stellaceae bacterium]
MERHRRGEAADAAADHRDPERAGHQPSPSERRAAAGRKSEAHSAIAPLPPSGLFAITGSASCCSHAGLSPQPGPGRDLLFTVNLLGRHSALLVTHIGALREAVRTVRGRLPFHIDAWVVLPDHMHALWTLPEGDADFPSRWRDIKTVFSKPLPATEQRSSVIVQRGERGIWQRRYWEHTIRDDRDYAAHMDTIHFNPVKHGLADDPADWPFSSF